MNLKIISRIVLLSRLCLSNVIALKYYEVLGMRKLISMFLSVNDEYVCFKG